MTKNVLEAMLAHNVWLNGLLIPFASVESKLSHYTQPLLISNNDETLVCSTMGSSMAIHYRGKYLLLCTRHQLKLLGNRSYEEVGILDKDGKNFCTAAGIRHFYGEINDSEIHDVVAFDFTAPCHDREHMKEWFFNLTQIPGDVPSDQIVGLVVSGFPFKDLNYDLYENRRIDFRKRIITCKVADKGAQPNDSSVVRLKPVERLAFDPDGISGGGAFVVQLKNGEPHAYLAGVIVRAGAEDIYIVKIGYILKFINSWLSGGREYGVCILVFKATL